MEDGGLELIIRAKALCGNCYNPVNVDIDTDKMKDSTFCGVEREAVCDMCGAIRPVRLILG